MSAPARTLSALPKAHLHLHLDGSYPRTAVAALAALQQVDFDVPPVFTSADDFFARYIQVPQLVRDLDDLRMLCEALVANEATHGVAYCEPGIEPQLFSPRLGNQEQILATMLDAFATAGQRHDIEVGSMIIVNTDGDPDDAAEPARLARRYAGNGVTAFGTAGFVEPGGLHRYTHLAEQAHDAGLAVVCHAGQTGGPASIRETLDAMAPDRIAHGIRAMEDRDLVDELAQRRIVLDVAISSNVALGIVASVSTHPVVALIDAGIAVTLNADDELWFGSSITDEYQLLRDVFGADDAALAEIATNGTVATRMSARTAERIVTGAQAWATSVDQPAAP